MSPLMPARSEILPGTVFGRDFEVVDWLAAGGMGTVYVALQLSTGKKRALKVMHGRHEGDDRTRKRFAQEARAGASIESDHMVETLGAGIDDDTGLPWIAMELLIGQDLKAVSEKRGALPPAEVLEIFRQMCHALAEAHREGVVHRDLKPENIFLANARREGVPFTVKVLDFGIAKLVAEATAASSQTQAVGSPRWMAPEQADRGGDICPATDVWALGLIAFQLLTGRCYWMTASAPSPSVMAQVCEILMEPLETASARATRLGCGDLIPPGFDAWFARCVVREIDARFPNAAEAMSALAPVLADPADIGIPLRSTLPPPRLSIPSPKAMRTPTPPTGIASLSGPVFADLSLPVAPRAELDPLSDRLPESLVTRPDPANRPISLYAVAGIVAVIVVGGGAIALLAHHPDAAPATVARTPTVVPVAPAVVAAPAPAAVTAPAVVATPDAAVQAAPTPVPTPMPTPAVAPVPPSQALAVAPVVADTSPVARGAHGARVAGGPGGASSDAAVDPTPAPSHEGDGLLDRGRVHEVLNEHTGEMESCFEHGTQEHPNVAGRLVLTFTLGDSPHPMAVATTGLEAAPAVGQCIQTLVRGLTFPAATGGTAFFSFPLRFSRGESAPAPTPEHAPAPEHTSEHSSEHTPEHTPEEHTPTPAPTPAEPSGSP